MGSQDLVDKGVLALWTGPLVIHFVRLGQAGLADQVQGTKIKVGIFGLAIQR